MPFLSGCVFLYQLFSCFYVIKLKDALFIKLNYAPWQASSGNTGFFVRAKLIGAELGTLKFYDLYGLFVLRFNLISTKIPKNCLVK